MRVIVGFIAALIAVGFVSTMVFGVNDNIRELLTASKSADFKVVLAAFGAFAIVSIAKIYFAYQMLRFAERMFLPKQMLWRGSNAEVMRAVQGIEDPAKFTAKQVVELYKDAKATLDTMNGKGDDKK